MTAHRLPCLLALAAACTQHVDPPPGHPRIVRVAAEPAGRACPAGGTRINAGIDDDASGTLEPDEIDATRVVCQEPASTVVHGDLVIEGDLDAAAAAAITAIEGSLIVDTAELSTPVELPALTRIGQALFYRARAGALVLPSLVEVGRTLTVQASDLAVPALQTVAGTIRISHDGPDPATFSLPALTSTGGAGRAIHGRRHARAGRADQRAVPRARRRRPAAGPPPRARDRAHVADESARRDRPAGAHNGEGRPDLR